MDYRNAYMDDKHLQKWMLDLAHLTLEKKILPSDKNYQTFNDFWHDKALAYGDQAQEDSCPLQALDNIMSDIYVGQFRNNEGVVTYYENKERAIPDMVNEMRHNIEADLFNQWKEGNISVVELVKISKLLVERVAELRIQLENDIISEEDEYKGVDKERQENVEEWKKMGIIRQKMLGKGSKLFAFHQDTLTEYYERKTRLVALEFAKKLASRLAVEIGKMDADILTFSQSISTAIDETERLVNAQKKVNKGIEDMSGAIIEVSEEDAIAGFEKDMAINKTDMPGIANSFREAILPKHDFTNFGHLASEIDFDTIKEAFDRTLSVKVVEIHSSLPTSAKKVLGMNVLTELQQALTSDEEINKFAYELVRQSGVFLKLDDNQMKLHLRNNEGPLSPTTNPASVNKMAVIVSIPSVERESDSMKRFQKKIIDAINQQFGNSAAQGAKPMINDESPRSDELSITSIQYCYPMRAASWLKQYKERYDRFLNTGNPSVDAQNAILLHSEGDGSELPNFFALTKDEINAKIAKRQQQQPQQPIAAQQPQQPAAPQQPAMPPRQPEMPPMPGVVLPPPPQEKPLQLFMSVAGQQYGPYDLEICKQLVANKQLTPQTMVWKEGLPAWVPAAQVADLQPLFMPPSMPGMPPMPPMPGGMPTPPPVM